MGVPPTPATGDLELFHTCSQKAFLPGGREAGVQMWSRTGGEHSFIYPNYLANINEYLYCPDPVLRTAAATERNYAQALLLSSAQCSGGVENKPFQQIVPAQLWQRQSKDYGHTEKGRNIGKASWRRWHLS